MQHDKQKERSIYMRFHVTLEKAMNFSRNLYGKAVIPHTNLTYFEHAIQISGLTEEIGSQDYINYHLTWLTGILKDTLTLNEEAYRLEIDHVLEQLYKAEADRIKRYIIQLTLSKTLPRGQRYKTMLNQVSEMDIVPCYIQIFELYSYCSLWQVIHWEKEIQEYEGFMSYAYMFWYKAISKHISIGKNSKQYIKDFFKKIADDLGGMQVMKQKAERLFNSI